MPTTSELSDSEDERTNADINLFSTYKKDLEDIYRFISRLPENQHMDAEEYLQIDKESIGETLLTDEDIVQTVQPNHDQSNELDPEEVPLPPPIKPIQALNHIQELLSFLSNLPDDLQINSRHIGSINSIRRSVLSYHSNQKTQKSLDFYFLKKD
jgi:hypothetical protein